MGLEFNHFSQLEAKLEELPKKIEKDISDNALKEGGKVILEQLKHEVMINVYDTGELYESLDLGKITGKGENKKISIGSQSDDRNVVERNYYNEYGTSSILGQKHNKKAFKNGKNEAKQAIIKALKEGLKSR